MGNCHGSDEVKKGPIRSRFSLDHAPGNIPKTLIVKNQTLPLIGYKDISNRKIAIKKLLRFDNSQLLTELYEYLPQYHMSLSHLVTHIVHPKGSTLYHISYDENDAKQGDLWKKEQYGRTWTETGSRTASYTYDPVLNYFLENIHITNLRIYDAKSIILSSVFVEAEDSDGNIHRFLPYSVGPAEYAYKIAVTVKKAMYLDELEHLEHSLRTHLYKPDTDTDTEDEPTFTRITTAPPHTPASVQETSSGTAAAVNDNKAGGTSSPHTPASKESGESSSAVDTDTVNVTDTINAINKKQGKKK